MKSRKPAQPNQSLIDGLECLEAVAIAGQPMGVRELGRLLDLEPTRVSRLLGTLAYLGLTEKTADRKYTPGPGIHVLSAMGLRGSDLLKVSLPVIRKLMLKRKLGVALGVLWRRHVCYLYHGGPDKPIEQAIGGHELHPAEHSSIGRVILASRPKSEIQSLFGSDPELDLKQLQGELSGVARDGYCVPPRGDSLAVAIGDVPFAALAFSSRGRRKIEPLVADLREAAGEITRALEKQSGAAR